MLAGLGRCMCFGCASGDAGAKLSSAGSISPIVLPV